MDIFIVLDREFKAQELTFIVWEQKDLRLKSGPLLGVSLNFERCLEQIVHLWLVTGNVGQEVSGRGLV